MSRFNVYGFINTKSNSLFICFRRGTLDEGAVAIYDYLNPIPEMYNKDITAVYAVPLEFYEWLYSGGRVNKKCDVIIFGESGAELSAYLGDRNSVKYVP